MPTATTVKPPCTHEAIAALKPEDCDVLAAAGAGLLTSDSRFTGTINELRYLRAPGELGGGSRVPARQARRLRDTLGLIAPSAKVVHHESSARRELSTRGAPYTETTMTLTPAGLAVLAAIARGDTPATQGPARATMTSGSGRRRRPPATRTTPDA